MPAPVINVAQMREWEAATWAAGRTEAEVIARVGGIVAARASALTHAGDLILIIAGKGHNGDDARHAADHLSERRVQVLNVKDPSADGAQVISWLEQRPALVIDGLFGIGLNRPLDAAWSELINRINEFQARILAVDVPSGLNAETGEAEGAAIRATVTLTLGTPKLGLLLPHASQYVGRLEVAPEIGLVPCPHTSEWNWTLPEDFDDYPPPRAVESHKGDFGRLAILAGSLGYHGAAVLAARGAQRAQPGLITLYTAEAAYHVVASQLQAVMVNAWRPNLKLPGDFDAILIGPGLAAELPEVMKAGTRQLWEHAPVPIIVDASALDWLKTAKSAREDAIRVVTPHPGEAARLLGISPSELQAKRFEALREVSRRLSNCWVILKGNQTLIGRSTGVVIINSSGNPHLAQGGSGDVLAGFLAGLLAQAAPQTDPLRCLSYGVWQHGAAADRLTESRTNWVVEDLAAEIGNRAAKRA